MTANIQDEDELQQIVEQGYQSCSFDGCDYGIDPRGPASLRGTSYPVCSPHFEAVFGVIGRQQQQQPYDLAMALAKLEEMKPKGQVVTLKGGMTIL
jgi:hypothetical protein